MANELQGLKEYKDILLTYAHAIENFAKVDIESEMYFTENLCGNVQWNIKSTNKLDQIIHSLKPLVEILETESFNLVSPNNTQEEK